MKKILFIVISFLVTNAIYAQNTSVPISQDDIKILPVLWQQNAAEYDALCYQAYNLAELRISKFKKGEIKRKFMAIVTDIDETLMNNSYFEANLIKNGETYTFKNWKDWTDHASATPMAGALNFFKKAKSMGFEIYYISDRRQEEMPKTIENLKKYGFPEADEQHILLSSANSTKVDRRHKVAEKHNIVLLLGDNLNDFKGVFVHQNIADRKNAAAEIADECGRRFIVLPNPVYGEWENALYEYNFKLSPEEKKELRLKLLKGY